MYSVIDLSAVPQKADRSEAVDLKRELVLANPEADWQLVSTIPEVEPDNNALERLYALCHQLLTVSKINPVKLEMKLTNILGEETTYTAARIMIDARAQLDA